MSATPATRRRLAAELDQKRKDLGLSLTAFARRSGLSVKPVQSILRAEEVAIRDVTAQRLEVAAGWASGSIQAILEGGNPAPAEIPYPGGTLADVDTDVLMDRIDHDAALTDDEIAASLRVLARIADRLGDHTVAAWLAGRQSGPRRERGE